MVHLNARKCFCPACGTNFSVPWSKTQDLGEVFGIRCPRCGRELSVKVELLFYSELSDNYQDPDANLPTGFREASSKEHECPNCGSLFTPKRGRPDKRKE